MTFLAHDIQYIYIFEQHVPQHPPQQHVPQQHVPQYVTI